MPNASPKQPVSLARRYLGVAAPIVLAGWGTLLTSITLTSDTPQHPLASGLRKLFNQKVWPLEKWNADYRSLCIPVGQNFRPQTKEQKILYENLTAFRDSDPLAAHLYNEMKKADTGLCLKTDNPDTAGTLHLGYNAVFLDHKLTPQQMHVTMAHEFRHREQANNGYHVKSMYSFDDNLRIIFAKEADAEAVGTLYAWRMRLKGREDYWRAAQAMHNYSDIQHSFERQLAAGKTELDATRAAFSAWYSYFHRPNQYHIDARVSQAAYMLATGKAGTGLKILENEFFNGISRLPDGTDYGAQETPEPYLTTQQVFDKSSLFLEPQ